MTICYYMHMYLLRLARLVVLHGLAGLPSNGSSIGIQNKKEPVSREPLNKFTHSPSDRDIAVNAWMLYSSNTDGVGPYIISVNRYDWTFPLLIFIYSSVEVYSSTVTCIVN